MTHSEGSGFCPICGHPAKIAHEGGILTAIKCGSCDFFMNIVDQFEKIYGTIPGFNKFDGFEE